MSDFYHDQTRLLQERFDTRRLADRIEQRLVVDRIGDADKAFIESLDMFFLATADDDGQPSCSYKGGEPGFVLASTLPAASPVNVRPESVVSTPAPDPSGPNSWLHRIFPVS